MYSNGIHKINESRVTQPKQNDQQEDFFWKIQINSTL